MKTLIAQALFNLSRRTLILVAAFALVFAATPAHATTVIAPDFDGLVSGADCIVRASVTSVTSAYRSTSSGRAIFTKVELQVLETITGTPPAPLVLELLGGTVDGVTMRVEGVPQFKVGDEDILFVQNNGKQYFPLVGIMNGKYPVKSNPQTGAKYVARSNGTPLFSSSEVKTEMTSPALAQSQHAGQAPLSPADFANQIRSTKNNQLHAAQKPSVAN